MLLCLSLGYKLQYHYKRKSQYFIHGYQPDLFKFALQIVNPAFFLCTAQLVKRFSLQTNGGSLAGRLILTGCDFFRGHGACFNEMKFVKYFWLILEEWLFAASVFLEKKCSHFTGKRLLKCKQCFKVQIYSSSKVVNFFEGM